MRIVVIGGKGLIGRCVMALAKSKGHEVLALTRQHPIQDQKIRTEYWNGKDVDRLSEILKTVDAVVNLAGENIGKRRWTTGRKEVLLNSRLEPAKALVEALGSCQNPPHTLIQASAIGYYGTGNGVKTEDAPNGADYLSGFASTWEKATAGIERLGIRRIIIRSGVVLDAKQGVLPQLKLPFQLMVGGRVGSGDQVYSWIHIHDEAAAIVYLLENQNCSGVYNLTAPEPVTNREMGLALAKVMHRPFWFPLPAFVLRLVLGEMSTLVLDGQRVLPARLLQSGFIFQFPIIETALNDLILPY